MSAHVNCWLVWIDTTLFNVDWVPCGLEMFFLGLEFCNLFPEKLAPGWCYYEKSSALGINKAQNIDFKSKVSSHPRRVVINRSSVILKCLVIEFLTNFIIATSPLHALLQSVISAAVMTF